jgi:hypothetical protein
MWEGTPNPSLEERSDWEDSLMGTLRIVDLAIFWMSVLSNVQAQTAQIKAAETKNHVGEQAIICSTVVSPLADHSKGNPTFFISMSHILGKYSRFSFGAVTDPNLATLQPSPLTRNLCVTGLIKDCRGVPEIVVEQPNHIEVGNHGLLWPSCTSTAAFEGCARQ